MNLKPSLWCAAVVLAGAASASAHFVWIDAKPKELKDGGVELRAGFGEPGDWDADLADKIKQTKYFVRTANGDEKELSAKLDSEEGRYVLSSVKEPACAVLGVCDYGLFGRGNEPPSMLRYYAKTLVGAPASWTKTQGSKKLAIEATPKLEGETIVITVVAGGKPLVDGKVNVYGPKSNRVVLTTDSAGVVKWPVEGAGTYRLFVGHKIDEKGEHDSKKFESARHYATLTFDIPAGNALAAAAAKTTEAAAAKTEVVAARTSQFPALPEAISSFGAVVSDGWLYVYGGHTGKAHAHSLANLSKGFYRLNLAGHSEWESLPMETPLQGMPLVANRGMIYRVGGLTAKNATTETTADTVSVAEFSRYNPQTKKWQALAPLPAGRSSHDAAVWNDKLFVVGGWGMGGKAKKENDWHTDVLVCDLSQANPSWEIFCEQSFERRALTVAVHDGKLFAIGGIASDGAISLNTDILDLATKKWSSGPALPSGPTQGPRMSRSKTINGFGCSAWDHDGKLYVSGHLGEVYCLGEKGWDVVTKIEPARFFHRLLPYQKESLLAVGGAAPGGHLDVVESFSIR